VEAPDGKIALLEGMATPAWSALLGSGVRLGDGESKRRFFGRWLDISWSSCVVRQIHWHMTGITGPDTDNLESPSKKMKSKKQRNASEEDEQENLCSHFSAQPSGSVLFPHVGQKTSLCSSTMDHQKG